MPELCQENDRRLHIRSSDIDAEHAKELVETLRNIIENVTWGSCVGMAAPQVGINKRVFIALGKAYINPVIVHRSESTLRHTEGCYSVGPGICHTVARHNAIDIRYESEDGTHHSETLEGFTAQVVQHEYDHLEGVLISTRSKRNATE